MEPTNPQENPTPNVPQASGMQISSTSASPSKIKTLFIVLLILFGFAAFGVGGYWLGTQKVNKTSMEESSMTAPTQAPTAMETPTATTAAQPTIALLPTTTWGEISNGVISLKYPKDEYTPQTTDNFISFKPITGSSDGQACNCPNVMVANNYNGGSRRQWWIDFYSYAPEEMSNVSFTEMTLGTNQVLFVKQAQDTGVREILYAKNNTLVDILIQGADLKTIETMVSTLKIL